MFSKEIFLLFPKDILMYLVKLVSNAKQSEVTVQIYIKVSKKYDLVNTKITSNLRRHSARFCFGGYRSTTTKATLSITAGGGQSDYRTWNN